MNYFGPASFAPDNSVMRLNRRSVVAVLLISLGYGHSMLWTTTTCRRLNHHCELHRHRSVSVISQASSESLLSHHHDLLNKEDPIMTTALLRISYDGGGFTGWSAANDHDRCSIDNNRRRTKHHSKIQCAGFVRSVQGTIEDCLSRLYGNLPVVVEGCSRTDKGVHARNMVTQFYCVDPMLFRHGGVPADTSSFSIPGKRQPHPWSATDTSYFKPLPTTDLKLIQYKLNRMLPSDVRILDIAPVPVMSTRDASFHPTLSSTSKTYDYTLSVGENHDPTQCQSTWHIGDQPLDLPAMQEVCRDVLIGKHDFSAFHGAPRSKRDRQKQSTRSSICTILQIDILEVVAAAVASWSDRTAKVYTVRVTGDRFLYKMMRFLVGVLVAVGHGKISTDEVRAALAAGDRNGLPKFVCAPAKGLVLANVDYNGVYIDWLSLSED